MSLWSSGTRWVAQASPYHAITQRKLFDAFMCGARLPRKRVVITFDDGYRDVHKYALPVLERFRMHAIAYVITGRIWAVIPASSPGSSCATSSGGA